MKFYQAEMRDVLRQFNHTRVDIVKSNKTIEAMAFLNYNQEMFITYVLSLSSLLIKMS